MKVIKNAEGIDTERMLAYSELSGMLYIPNQEPAFFNDIKKLKYALSKTIKYNKIKYPDLEKNCEYIIYKLDISVVKA